VPRDTVVSLDGVLQPPDAAPASRHPERREADVRRTLDATVFDPAAFRRAATRVVSRLEAYLRDCSTRGVALTSPAALLEAARNLMSTEDAAGSLDERRLDAIIDLYIRTGIQVHSPGFMGRQFSGVMPLAAVVDLISSTVNQPSSFYEAAQLPNVAERIMAEELNRFVGWEPGRFAMVTTSGASLANLTAMLAARHSQFPDVWTRGLAAAGGDARPAIAIGDDAHYSVCRAAGILGIGEEQIVRLPMNRRRQIRVDCVRPVLRAAAERGLRVFCLVASAGTTSVGAFDPLEELAAVAAEEDVWLHVDAAHGASLLVSDSLRHRLRGIDRADSFSWDAHKMMFVPAMCTLLFYRCKEKSYGAFRQDASYVFDKEPDAYTEFESATQSFECTKRPMIMSLWVLWALYGRSVFARKIEYLCRLAGDARRILDGERDFEAVHEPEANILCFRYLPSNLARRVVPDFQVRVRNGVRRAGRFFISKVDIDGEAALRVVFMNHRTDTGHFRMLLDEIRRAGQAVLAEEDVHA